MSRYNQNSDTYFEPNWRGREIGTAVWVQRGQKTAGLYPVRLTNPASQSGSGRLAVPDQERGYRFGSHPDQSGVTRKRC